MSDKEIKEREHELWKQWKATKNPVHLDNLLKSYEPVIQTHLSRYKGADISPYSLRAEAERLVLQAIKSYDPSKGSLNTYVNWTLRGLGRHVERFQNVTRVPAHHIRKITAIKAAKEKGLTLNEMAKMAKKHEVATVLERTKGAKLLDRADWLGVHTVPAEIERLHLIGATLKGKHKEIFHRLLAGKRPTEISRELKISPAAVSHTKNLILKRLTRARVLR
jgi:hypothetical protein